jgi:hypothetical protein
VRTNARFSGKQAKNSIKATARKYGVEPSQIRSWKKSFNDAMTKAVEAPVYVGRPNPTITKLYRRLNSNHRSRAKAGGRPTLFNEEFLSKIKTIIDDRRRQNLGVQMSIIRNEARKIDPQHFDRIAETAFNSRMYRMMKKWEISFRRRTTTAKVPQNTRHVETVTQEFVKYFKFQVKLMDLTSKVCFNVDQTNLPFSMETSYTWAQRTTVVNRSIRGVNTKKNRCVRIVGMQHNGAKVLGTT